MQSIRFSIDTDGIEAKELAKILQDSRLALKEISIASSIEETEPRIFPFKKGSFEYVLAIAAIGTTAINTFKSIIDYKKSKLDYKKSQLEGRKKLKNIGEEENHVKQIIHLNPKIDIHINGMLKTISENGNGFSLKDSKREKTFIVLKSEEIKRIIKIENKRRKKENVKRKTIKKSPETLYLVKTSAKNFGKWEFIYDNIKIKAAVAEKIKRNYYYAKLSPGSKILVSLEIRQEFNTSAKVWENIGYRISEIVSVKP